MSNGERYKEALEAIASLKLGYMSQYLTLNDLHADDRRKLQRAIKLANVALEDEDAQEADESETP